MHSQGCSETVAEVKASSPIRTSLNEREGSMWGSLKRPSLRHPETLFPYTFKALGYQPSDITQHVSIIDKSRSDDNALCHEMLTTFGFTEAQMHRAAERFHLGRSKSGKTIYWMIDDMGCCLDGHIGCISYDPDTWVSTLLKRRYPSAAPYLTVKHCLFGLHQITEYDIRKETQADPLMGRAYQNVRATGGAVASPFEGGLGGSAPLLVRFLGANEKMNRLMPIGIVESERSAVLLSELCPELLWLAYSYGTNCTVDKFEPLQGHKITIYPRTDPDQEYYYSFLDLADQVKRTYRDIDISVSRFLEDNASEDQKARNIDLLEFMLES